MNRTPGLVDALRGEIATAPPADLPAIIGQLEAVKAEAFARLVSPPVPNTPPADTGDRLLDVHETAEKLGQKIGWVYGHASELPRVALPGRTLRFSERRLERYIARRSKSI